MGRELRRKQAKKEGKSLKKIEETENNQLKKLIIIIIIITLLIGLIYLLSALFVTKELDWFSKEKEQTSENTSSNIILASSIFKQSDEDYYVYIYDFKDENKNIANKISLSLSSKKVYKVDTSSAMNKKIVSDESNKTAKKLEDLHVIAPTLIRITDNEIVEYYEGDEILSNLN